MYNEEYLEHHGVLGQKWGVRRYQNPDGSLTKAGAKRQEKIDAKKYKARVAAAKKARQAKADKAKAAEKENNKNNKLKSQENLLGKKANKMTNDELDDAINRLTKQINYVQALEKYQNITAIPKKSSFFKKVTSTLVYDVVTPAAIEIGRQATKSIMAESLNKMNSFRDPYQIHTNNKKKG